MINLYIVILVDLSWKCWFVLTRATSWCLVIFVNHFPIILILLLLFLHTLSFLLLGRCLDERLCCSISTMTRSRLWRHIDYWLPLSAIKSNCSDFHNCEFERVNLQNKKEAYFVETGKFGCVYFTPKSSHHSAQSGFCSTYDRPRGRGAVDVPRLHLFRSLAERPPHRVADRHTMRHLEGERPGWHEQERLFLWLLIFPSLPPSLSLSLSLHLSRSLAELLVCCNMRSGRVVSAWTDSFNTCWPLDVL